MNILLSSVGRRVQLVKLFKDALKGRGRVIGANMIAGTPGMQAVDLALVTPPAHHPEYGPYMADLCCRHEIGLHCSLHDLETAVLSRHSGLLKASGAATTLPSAEWGRIALDKWECSHALQAAGFDTPWSTLSLDRALKALGSGAIRYPVIVKARHGFGSLGLKTCHDERALIAGYESAMDAVMRAGIGEYLEKPLEHPVLIQEHLDGQDIRLVIFNDLEGGYLAHFTCESHLMQGGESAVVTSIDREAYGHLARSLSALLAHRGPCGIDVIRTSDRITILDINPRFTGDYPFHHLAGADLPAALIQLAQGRSVDPAWLSHQAGLSMSKDAGLNVLMAS